MSSFGPGDTVRATGEVIGLSVNGTHVTVQLAGSREVLRVSDLELVERAKPKWQDGDVIHIRTSGHTLIRRKGNWYTARGLVFWHEDPLNEMNRSLIPVIQGGKPVVPAM